MPRPLEFHTPNRRSVRLPLEGGAPRSEFKIYMTAGGSHASTTLAQRQLRLMRSKLSTITMGWYKIATFDLIRHGLWPVTPSPPGEGFRLTISAYGSRRAGHAAAPTLNNQLRPTPHPSLIRKATSLPEKAILCSAGVLLTTKIPSQEISKEGKGTSQITGCSKQRRSWRPGGRY